MTYTKLHVNTQIFHIYTGCDNKTSMSVKDNVNIGGRFLLFPRVQKVNNFQSGAFEANFAKINKKKREIKGNGEISYPKVK